VAASVLVICGGGGGAAKVTHSTPITITA